MIPLEPAPLTEAQLRDAYPCPTCHAAVGIACRSRTGHPAHPHRKRRDLWRDAVWWPARREDL